MRLALLSPLPPDSSALAAYAAQYKRALNQVEIDVLTPLTGQRPITSLAAARAWVAERDWRRIDVVHAELTSGSQSEFWVLAALSRLADRPALSVTLHEPDKLAWRPLHQPWLALSQWSWLPAPLRSFACWLASPLTLLAERRLARRIEGFVVHTKCAAERVIKRLKVPPERVNVIAPGLSAAGFRPSPPGNLIKVLCVAGVGQRAKSLELVLQAWQRARDASPPVVDRLRMTFVGMTPSGLMQSGLDDPLLAVRHAAAKRGLEEQIQWVVDPDPRDVTPLMAEHHVMVLPGASVGTHAQVAHAEALVRHQDAVQLALANSRPMIVLDQAGLAESVEAGNGVSYQDNDPDALAQVLTRLAGEDSPLDQWFAQAQAVLQDRHWSRQALKHLAYFQQVRGRAPVAAREA